VDCVDAVITDADGHFYIVCLYVFVMLASHPISSLITYSLIFN
jgi:hypothetical protein